MFQPVSTKLEFASRQFVDVAFFDTGSNRVATVGQEPMAVPFVCLSVGVPGLTSFVNCTFMDFISTINIIS